MKYRVGGEGCGTIRLALFKIGGGGADERAPDHGSAFECVSAGGVVWAGAATLARRARLTMGTAVRKAEFSAAPSRGVGAAVSGHLTRPGATGGRDFVNRPSGENPRQPARARLQTMRLTVNLNQR